MAICWWLSNYRHVMGILPVQWRKCWCRCSFNLCTLASPIQSFRMLMNALPQCLNCQWFLPCWSIQESKIIIICNLKLILYNINNLTGFLIDSLYTCRTWNLRWAVVSTCLSHLWMEDLNHTCSRSAHPIRHNTYHQSLVSHIYYTWHMEVVFCIWSRLL